MVLFNNLFHLKGNSMSILEDVKTDLNNRIIKDVKDVIGKKVSHISGYCDEMCIHFEDKTFLLIERTEYDFNFNTEVYLNYSTLYKLRELELISYSKEEEIKEEDRVRRKEQSDKKKKKKEETEHELYLKLKEKFEKE